MAIWFLVGWAGNAKGLVSYVNYLLRKGCRCLSKCHVEQNAVLRGRKWGYMRVSVCVCTQSVSVCGFYKCIRVCWHPEHGLQHVLCMQVLWASQLSYSCVVWPLCLIIYSLRCHTAGWLCSLQLVFHFSPHLACLNKTVSILKALSFSHAVTRHKVMTAAG